MSLNITILTVNYINVSFQGRDTAAWRTVMSAGVATVTTNMANLKVSLINAQVLAPEIEAHYVVVLMHWMSIPLGWQVSSVDKVRR